MKCLPSGACSLASPTVTLAVSRASSRDLYVVSPGACMGFLPAVRGLTPKSKLPQRASWRHCVTFNCATSTLRQLTQSQGRGQRLHLSWEAFPSRVVRRMCGMEDVDGLGPVWKRSSGMGVSEPLSGPRRRARSKSADWFSVFSPKTVAGGACSPTF